MLRLSELIQKQAETLLGSRQRALLYAMIFSVLPYCAWLAMVVIALVTLRKGERAGGHILVWVMLVHAMVSLPVMPISVTLINTMIFFVPGYIAACTLRITSSWQAVAAVLFLFVTVSALLVQLFMPEWITGQYAVIQSILKTSQPDHAVLKWLNEDSNVPALVLANYVFGIQLMSAMLSVLSSLMMARSLQSRLYYPGGFKHEMLTFRGNRLSFVVMMVVLLATWQWNTVAMNVILVLSLFYVMAGLSLCASLIMSKISRFAWFLLLLPVILMPFVMLPMYIFLGLLDSIFNIRLAFAVKRG
ncbi:MAG: hypothetical protein CK424_07200 [Legionella sp.]|nr:MAG: hypothetical protein CK424_07200 [Legionella sp.]